MPGVAQRVGRGIALLFHDRGTRRWVSGQQHAPAALYPRERPGTHCTGGWVGPRAGLDRCGKSCPSPTGFDPGPSSPGNSVAIPTELPVATNYPRILTNYLVQQCMHANFLLVSPLHLLNDGGVKDSIEWEVLNVEAAPLKTARGVGPLYEDRSELINTSELALAT